MAANHAEYRARRAMPAPTETRLANVQAVLELDATTYVLFRGRAYGVPPVGWRAGQQILSLRLEATRAAGDGHLTPETIPGYFKALGELGRVLWRHTRPTGRFRRLLKRLGLLRNPFLDGTEAELVALTDFFLQRRMTSSVGRPPAILHPSTTS
jgi:hypothetical protein